MTLNTLKIKLARALASAIILAAAFGGCAETQSEGVTRVVTVMSTVATIKLHGADERAACDAVADKLVEFERESSRFVSGSDISRINAAAGKNEVSIGENSYIMLSAAVGYARESAGAFDVTVGALTSLWGIGADAPRVPSPEEIDAARGLVDISNLELSERDGGYFAYLTKKGCSLDLGGCAKGYALDLCRAELEKYGIDYGFVSLGGNVMLYGDKGGEGFSVGVRYPEQSSTSSVCLLRLSDTCVATTGGYERFFEQDGESFHHVLDPATGYPAKSDVLSATVVNADGMRGDYLSTRLFMLGVDKALTLMREGGVQAVIIADDNTVFISRSLEGALIKDSIDPDYSYEFV